MGEFAIPLGSISFGKMVPPGLILCFCIPFLSLTTCCGCWLLSKRRKTACQAGHGFAPGMQVNAVIDGQTYSGLVTSTSLDSVEVCIDGTNAWYKANDLSKCVDGGESPQELGKGGTDAADN